MKRKSEKEDAERSNKAQKKTSMDEGLYHVKLQEVVLIKQWQNSQSVIKQLQFVKAAAELVRKKLVVIYFLKITNQERHF